jgi:hypothetical protein
VRPCLGCVSVGFALTSWSHFSPLVWYLDYPIALRFSSPRSFSGFATLILAPGWCHIGFHFSSPRSASGFPILSLAPGLCPIRVRFLVPSIFLSVCHSIFGTWIVSFRFPLLVPSIFLTVAYSNFGTWIVSFQFTFLVLSIFLKARYCLFWHLDCVLSIYVSRPLDLPQGSLLSFLAPGLCPIGLGFSSPRSASGFGTLFLAPGSSY